MHGSEDHQWFRQGNVEFRASTNFVNVDGTHLPEWLEVEVVDTAQAALIGRVEIRGGVPHVAEVRLVSRPGQREVKQDDLRKVRVAALLDFLAAVRSWGDVDGTRYLVGHLDSRDAEAVRAAVEKVREPKRSRSLTPEFLAEVADFYRASFAVGPVQQIMERYCVANRTAAGWVERARKYGFLPETTKGRKLA